MTNENVGIVLEGGAMRSVFSAGVIDFLLEKDIRIPNVLAISAGAYAGMNYVSGQRGRIMDAVVNPLKEYKYLGFGTFIKKGTFFDMEYLFEEVPKNKAHFDFEKLQNFKGRFITSTVDCETGETVYHENFKDEQEFFRICKAANSLPLIAKISHIGGRALLDGGMADAIPIQKALEEGWDKVIVIFTRDDKYRKKEGRNMYQRLIRLVYRKYPKFLEVVEGRAKRYNDAIETVLELEKQGKAFVLRPSTVTVGNNESHVDRLVEAYQHGYDSIATRYEELLEFLAS